MHTAVQHYSITDVGRFFNSSYFCYNSSMTHLAGKKFSKSHTTAIKTAEKIGKFLARQSDVSKIIVGEIKPIRVGQKRLKIQPIEAGLKLAIRDTSALQTIYVYTKKQQEISKIIEHFWSANCA